MSALATTPSSAADRRVPLAAALVWLVALAEMAWLLPGGRSDDAEILLHTQAFAWGYRLRNPPLFDWLAWAGMQLTGPTPVLVFALRLGCMALGFWLLWKLARRAGLDALPALASALAPLWVLQFFYYALADLTHTVLSGVFYAATVWAVWRARELPGWRRMAVLGGVVGLGLLTKYLFALFVGAALLACWLVPAYRVLLRPGRLGVALLVALGIALPHLLWVLHQDHATFAEQQRQSLETAGHWSVRNTLAGLGALLGYTLAVTLPWLLVGGLCSLDARRPQPVLAAAAAGGRGEKSQALATLRASDADLRWLAWTLALSVAAIALSIVGFGASRVRPHHLVFLSLAPLAVMLFLARRRAALFARMQPGLRRFTRLTVAWVAVALLAFAVDARRFAQRCELCGPQLDYAQLAQGLRAQGLEGGTLYYASRHRLLNPPMLRQYLDLRVVWLDAPSTESPLPARPQSACAWLWMPGVEDDADATRLAARVPAPLATARHAGSGLQLATRLKTVDRAGQPLMLAVSRSGCAEPAAVR